MIKQLRISDDLSLPLETAAAQTFAFIARKGAGKTYAAGKLAELLIDAGVQVVVLDLVGNWYGLRLAADGKSPGLDVPVFGGLRGDIALEETGGELMANTLTATGRSAVLDISQFSKAARQRFAASFGERLWLCKKGERAPRPLFLIIEECQLIVPQEVRGDTARMVGIYEEIIRLGRNYAVGVAMISQRPQSVNKEVLNQTECLFVLQTNGAQERDALKKWIVAQGADVDLVKELPSLPIGTAYVWSPQWLGVFKRVRIAKKVTYDASATRKVGDVRTTRELAPLDLGALREAMAATIERAKANDPKALRADLAYHVARNRELERLLAAKPEPKTETKVKEVPALSAADRKAIENAAKVFKAAGESLDRTRKELEHFVLKIGRAANDGDIAAVKLMSALATPMPSSVAVRHAPEQKSMFDRTNGPAHFLNEQHTTHISKTQARAERAAARTARSAGEAALTTGQRSVLTAVLQAGDAGISRPRLTTICGYARSTRNRLLQELHALGCVENQGEIVFATEQATVVMPDYEPLPTGEALYEYWKGKLGEGQRKVLEVVCKAYPGPIHRDDISEQTGYARSTRNRLLQELAAPGLIKRSDGDGVIASAELFD